MKVELSASRRTFMASAAILSGFAALFGMVKRAPTRAKEPMPEQERVDEGYRLTEHVQKYYETARL